MVSVARNQDEKKEKKESGWAGAGGLLILTPGDRL